MFETRVAMKNEQRASDVPFSKSPIENSVRLILSAFDHAVALSRSPSQVQAVQIEAASEGYQGLGRSKLRSEFGSQPALVRLDNCPAAQGGDSETCPTLV